MSLINDPNKKVPDLSKLSEKLQNSALDKAGEQVNRATQELQEGLDKARSISEEVKNKVTQVQRIQAQVSEEVNPWKNDKFEIIPPEVIEKQQALSRVVSYGGDLASLYGDSHLVWSTVQIGGEDVLTDSHFTLKIEQKVGNHDTFTIECYSDAFGEKDAYPMTNTRNYLGKRCTLQLKQYGQTTYIFTGIITNIKNKRIDGSSKIILEGKSPTYLLENGKDCQSFEQKNLKEIIEEATKEYPSDLIQWDIRPHYQEKLLYTVQYRESDFQFVQRLANRYGEWFYYTGTNLVFGGNGGKTVELVEEQDLYEYELQMKLLPQKFTYLAYGAKQAEEYTVNSEDVKVQGTKNPFQQHAVEASEQAYSKVPLSLYNQSLLESGRMEVTAAVKRQKEKQQNVFYLSAKTHNPNIRLGDIVKLKAWMPGHQIFKNGEVPLESYRVIEVTHNYEGQDGYHNLIVGIPKEIEVPPYMEEDSIPQCEEQSAIVMDNNDKEGLSRIRVQFPWQKPFNGMTPWIRSITPYAGSGKGMHVVPEIGEEVIINFENGNAEKPISLGAMFNGKGKSGHGGAGNYMKGLQTAAGSNLTFNDQKGDMTLADKGGASMNFDGAGNATTVVNQVHAVNAGSNSNTSVGEDASTLKMDASGNITLDGKTNITLKVGANTIVIDQNGLTFTNKDGNSVAITPEGITNTAKIGDMKSTAESGIVSIESKSDTATFKGSTDTNIGGGSMTYVTGGEVEINQS